MDEDLDELTVTVEEEMVSVIILLLSWCAHSRSSEVQKVIVVCYAVNIADHD